jgi:hypothetical protein
VCSMIYKDIARETYIYIYIIEHADHHSHT